MNNQQILNNIIENNVGTVPADVLEAFRQEAMESGYNLDSKEGTLWYTSRSILAQWHKANNEAIIAANAVKFFWDFEQVGNGEFIKTVCAEGIEIQNLNEYAQDNGLSAARRYVKKLARKAGKSFVETTDAGIARDYARARINAINEQRT